MVVPDSTSHLFPKKYANKFHHLKVYIVISGIHSDVNVNIVAIQHDKIVNYGDIPLYYVGLRFDQKIDGFHEEIRLLIYTTGSNTNV